MPPRDRILNHETKHPALLGYVMSDSTLALKSVEILPNGKTVTSEREPVISEGSSWNEAGNDLVSSYAAIQTHIVKGACLNDLANKWNKERGCKGGQRGFPVHASVWFWNLNDVFGKSSKRSKTMSPSSVSTDLRAATGQSGNPHLHWWHWPTRLAKPSSA